MSNIVYLKSFRIDKKLKLTEMAKLIGCPRSTYHYVENGRTELSADHLAALISIFPDFDIFTFLNVNNKYLQIVEKYESMKESQKIIDDLQRKNEILLNKYVKLLSQEQNIYKED